CRDCAMSCLISCPAGRSCTDRTSIPTGWYLTCPWICLGPGAPRTTSPTSGGDQEVSVRVSQSASAPLPNEQIPQIGTAQGHGEDSDGKPFTHGHVLHRQVGGDQEDRPHQGRQRKVRPGNTAEAAGDLG